MISLMLLVFSYLLLQGISRVRYIHNLAFGLWMRTVLLVLSDNRVLISYDEGIWGCDYFDCYKSHTKDMYILKRLKIEKRTPDIFLNKYYCKILSNKDYKKALFLTSMIKVSAEDKNFIDFMQRREVGYDFSSGYMNLKSNNGVLDLTIYAKVKGEKMKVQQFKKLLDHHDIYHLVNMLAKISSCPGKIIGDYRDGSYQSGPDFESVLNNPSHFDLAKVNEGVIKPYYVHGEMPVPVDHYCIGVNCKQCMISQAIEAKERGCEVKLTSKTFKKTGVKHKLIRALFTVLSTVLFLKSTHAMQAFYLLIYSLGSFRKKVLLWTVFRSKSVALFKFINCTLGFRWQFCSMVYHTPVRIKRCAYLSECKALKGGVKISAMNNFDLREIKGLSCGEEVIYEFEKEKVWMMKGTGDKLFVTIEDQWQVAEYELLLSDDKVKTMVWLFNSVLKGRIQGLALGDNRIMGIHFIHLASASETISILSSSGTEILEVTPEEESYSGTDEVELKLNASVYENCKMNGWGDLKNVAIMAEFCTRFWGSRSTGEEFVQSLPMRQQTLNRKWFPKEGNAKLKMFMYNSSDLMYTLTGLSYHKLTKTGVSKALLEMKEIMAKRIRVKLEGSGGLDHNVVEFKVELNEVGDNREGSKKAGKHGGGGVEINEIINSMEEGIDDLISKHTVMKGNRMTLRESKPGGFEGWVIDNGIVFKGSSREKKRQQSEKFAEWIKVVGEENYREIMKNPVGYVKLSLPQLQKTVGQICTNNEKLKDVRLYMNEFCEGVLYSKKGTRILTDVDSGKDRNGGKFYRISYTGRHKRGECECDPKAGGEQDKKMIATVSVTDLCAAFESELNSKKKKRSVTEIRHTVKSRNKKNTKGNSKLKYRFKGSKIIPINYIFDKVSGSIEKFVGDRLSKEKNNFRLTKTKAGLNNHAVKSKFVKWLSKGIIDKIKDQVCGWEGEKPPDECKNKAQGFDKEKAERLVEKMKKINSMYIMLDN